MKTKLTKSGKGMDKTISLTEWEVLYSYTHLVRSRRYLKVLVAQGGNEYATRDLRRLDKYRLRLRKYAHEVRGVSYVYLDNID